MTFKYEWAHCRSTIRLAIDRLKDGTEREEIIELLDKELNRWK